MAAAWGVAALSVWAWTVRYEFATPAAGSLGQVQRWPEASHLQLADDRPTLLLFVHPRCPCTSASVHELERTLTGSGLSGAEQPQVTVVASIPRNAGDDWHASSTVSRAAGLPKTEVRWDDGGVETTRFGASISGTVMLFGQDGALLFAGGVTSSRGHEGDNVGCDRLLSLLSHRQNDKQPSTPVFGCTLCVDTSTTNCGTHCGPGKTSDETIVREVE